MRFDFHFFDFGQTFHRPLDNLLDLFVRHIDVDIFDPAMLANFDLAIFKRSKLRPVHGNDTDFFAFVADEDIIIHARDDSFRVELVSRNLAIIICVEDFKNGAVICGNFARGEYAVGITVKPLKGFVRSC